MAKLLPAVEDALQSAGVAYTVLACDPELADTAAFCEHYGFALSQSANTILVASRKTDPVQYAVCVVLATTKLDVNKKVCELMGVKKASFADPETTRELTGMEIGGVTAPGISELPVFVDEAVMHQGEIVMGGGNRSSKLVLSSAELIKLPQVTVVPELARPKPSSD